MRRALLLQSITFAVLIAVIVAMGSQINSNRKLAREGRQAHLALCTLRADLKSRIDDTRAFLVTHPDGLAGITAAEIQNSVANQQKTLDSLDGLKCQ